MEASLYSEPVVGERMQTFGVNWGPEGIILVHREGNWGVYKTPGHMAWTDQISPWHYVPACYGIVEIEEFAPAESNSYWGRIDIIYRSEVQPGAKWKAAIAELKEKVRKLAAGDITLTAVANIGRRIDE